MMRFCVKIFFGSKTFSFSQILMQKIRAKRGLSVVKRAKIVTFNEEGYSERQISKN